MIPLAQAADPAQHGGKAVNLARLMSAGVPVPDGIVVPAQRVARLARGEDHGLADQIALWAASQGRSGLVVRSSTPGEDGAEASFAGLFTSCFVSATPDDITRAVADVHGSVFSDLVTAYARARDVPAPDGTAVLIQPALRAAASGVLFTKWGTGWRIEATLGLAALLLGGEVAPDVYGEADGRRNDQPSVKHVAVIPTRRHERDLPPGEWLEWPHNARSKLVFSDGNLAYVRPSTELGRRPALDHAAVHGVRSLGWWAQAVMGSDALDIEWVQDTDGVLWLVQARPATSTGFNRRKGADKSGDELVGEAASSGLATGPAAVITPASDSPRMPDNGVLVCGSARPELVPALVEAAGIVSTDAGVLCHTAIVARELGKPCVTGVLAAPDIIRDGERITVDGDRGVVRLNDVPLRASEPQPLPLGLRVVAGPRQGPVVLAVDHETAAFVDRPPDVAGLLFPEGTDVQEPSVELPCGARLRWLIDDAETHGQLWAGAPDGHRTVLPLELP
ncbi:hypothetical protein HII36_09710 [Nonomuraea sp. NN258]|uniref:PEP/pyruvate-binding domain-containing protein n=1 Tax=Nonomuraea antri TaxID=2730852 RepID=UPI0015690573|nr:PEP/pyruvate-binding domain-containing protein [Nonomuraea antri]NRQ32112.1 hypothetical protein [Nonomuraea antri]